MTFLHFLATIAFGLFNRIRGGFLKPPSSTVGRITFALPLMFAAMLAYYGLDFWQNYAEIDFWLLFGVFPATWFGLTTGWGSYMDLGRVDREDNEVLKPLLDKIFGSDAGKPSFWRDFTGLVLRGFMVTNMAGVFVMLVTGSPIYWLSGMIMAPAYWLGWALPIKYPHFTKGPELGEVIFGSSLYIFLVLSF